MGRKKDEFKTGSGKRKSMKGTVKGKWQNQPKLEKMRPGQARKVHQGANTAPSSDDEDIAGVPKLAKNAFLPMIEPDAPQPLNVPKTGSQLRREKRLKMMQKRKEKRLTEPAVVAPKDEDEEKEEKLDLPKQKPGENKYAYFARLDKAVVAKLQVSNQKVTTPKMRAKKLAIRVAKKEKGSKRRFENNKDATDGLYAAGERTAHGDVAERPPVLSQAALRSRTKLKKRKVARTESSSIASKGFLSGEARNPAIPKVTSLRQPVKNNAGGASDLADYANKVREAYAAMKKQRLDSRERK